MLFRVFVGIVGIGALGDRRNAGALGGRQLAQIVLAKVLDGTCLYAGSVAGEADGIQIGLQNRVLIVSVVQTPGAEDLTHLAHGVLLIVAGKVLDELLLQGGRTLPAAKQLDGGVLIDGRGDGTLEAHAVVLVEVLILGADKGPLQIRAGLDLAQLGPLTVIGAVEILVFHPLAGLMVLRHDPGGLGQLDLGQVQIVVSSGFHQIQAQCHSHHAGNHHTQADAYSDKPEQTAEETAHTTLFLFGGMSAGTGRTGRALPAASRRTGAALGDVYKRQAFGSAGSYPGRRHSPDPSPGAEEPDR